MSLRGGMTVLALSLAAAPAWAAEPVGPKPARGLELADESPRVRLHLGKDTSLRLGGYLETYYAWNFNRPSNGITEFRAFDNRHNQFTLQAAALDLGFVSRHIEARFVGQVGTGPDTYYRASEPNVAGSALTPGSSANAWKHVQQAWMAWRPHERVTLDAGIFLSPIGPENMATYQNFHWSHSVMFFALPFYHAGARVKWSPVENHELRLGVYNGWNNVGDNNGEKSLGLDYTIRPSRTLTVGLLYFAGVERPSGALEGRAWRQMFDGWITWSPHERVALLAQLNGGFEPNTLGVSAWSAGNLSVRLELGRGLYLAGRSTVFWERRAQDGAAEAAPMAIPAGRIASNTLTLEVVPLTGLSFKLEGRNDRADENVYFARTIPLNASGAFVGNARAQTTLTLGVSAWF